IALEDAEIPYLVNDKGPGVDVVVSSIDAARARELLADLEQPSAPTGDAPPAAEPPVRKELMEPPTISLLDVDSGLPLGQISETQLQFLIDQLEEDPSDDHGYYIGADTVDLLETSGGDADLIELLKRAVSGRDGVQIRWRDR